MAEPEKGKLYQWDGVDYIEIEPSLEKKLPVTDEAFEVVKGIRKEAAKVIGMRPELGLTASAMLIAAAKIPDIAMRIKEYGQHIYSK